MDLTLHDLQEECDFAAREFLIIRGWPCQKSKVEAAVEAIRLGSRSAGSSINWLLDQIPKVPEQENPARRFNDLLQAIAALRARETPAELHRS
jgi:hypothetical protein